MTAISRRNVLGAPLLAALGVQAAAQTQPSGVAATLAPLAPGPFQPTLESLKTYRAPDWFRDAKFGIWGHWGPQAVPRMGDWYARMMYIPGSRCTITMSSITGIRLRSATRTSFRCGRRKSSTPKR